MTTEQVVLVFFSWQPPLISIKRGKDLGSFLVSSVLKSGVVQYLLWTSNFRGILKQYRSLSSGIGALFVPLSYCSYRQSCEMFNEVLVDSKSDHQPAGTFKWACTPCNTCPFNYNAYKISDLSDLSVHLREWCLLHLINWRNREETKRSFPRNLRHIERNEKDAIKPDARHLIFLTILANTWRSAAFLCIKVIWKALAQKFIFHDKSAFSIHTESTNAFHSTNSVIYHRSIYKPCLKRFPSIICL